MPYWDKVQAATSKLDHITAAAHAWEFVPMEAPSRGFNALNGFTDGQVFRDARFRLAFYLHQEGVNGSVAARDVVRSNCPRSNAPLPTVW